ncbi:MULTISPECIES: Holliday junction resolvase RuvX [unclassified Paraflavitalea]|uniref:Holliday junction resolvase RuvX n=1 Tax=unclassified Paraflavitalea TaxID=2798305 RepID=UPI003D354F14
MPRIVAIDFGKKRTGLAVTDPLQIIATGLTTVATPEVLKFLKEYTSKEEVSLFLVGDPKNWDETDTDATPLVANFLPKLRRHFPNIPVQTADERYTSKMAQQAMIDMGLKKKQRREKGLVDEIAATILLQEYLQSRG